MDWSTFLTSLFASVGGALGICLIILRSVKKRTETYIDDAIKHKFDKKLEEYKQNLSKQAASYEAFSKSYYDCIEKVVKQLIDVEKYLKMIQEGIMKCLDEGLTFDYIFNQNDDLNLTTNLSNVTEGLEQAMVTYYICLPDYIVDRLEDVLNIIYEYIGGIEREMRKLCINRASYQSLLDLGKNVHNMVNALSKCIREECLRQSGEL